jgi:hypothetical protein
VIVHAVVKKARGPPEFQAKYYSFNLKIALLICGIISELVVYTY